MGKNGKSNNPTDQARKEARRKELKKNKKQRAIVRQAVIKQKDPKHLITEMEALDKMEYDTDNPPPYNVQVIQAKRKKLKESFQKIQQYYVREEPKLAAELKQMELDYERRRVMMAEHWESVMQAQRVKLDEIPLPSEEPPVMSSIPLPSETGDLDIPIPATTDNATTSAVVSSSPAVISAPPVVKSILKGPLPSGRSSKFDQPPSSGDQKSKKKPPGPPPGSPPSLSEFECDDDEFELGMSLNDEYNPQEKPKKIRFNTDEHAKSSDDFCAEEANKTTVAKHGHNLHLPPPPPPPHVIPHPYALHPSLIAAPPPPPPPPQPSMNSSSGYGQRTGAMIPPPPSFQSSTTNRMMAPQHHQHQQSAQFSAKNHNQPYSYQQPPSSSTSASATASATTSSTQSTTIEAKPVLRNKLAEVVRFVPTSVMVRRDAKKPTGGPSPTSAYSPAQPASASARQGPYDYMSQQQRMYASANPLKAAYELPKATVYDPRQQGQQPDKPPKQSDSTYESFMKEIGKLL